MSCTQAGRLRLLALFTLTLLCGCATETHTKSPDDDAQLLLRRYRAGEKFTYQMTGEDTSTETRKYYSVQLSGDVKRDTAGIYFEELYWTNLVFNGLPVSLPSASSAPRLILSLDLRQPAIRFPDMSKFHRKLFPPIGDLLNFYADEFLAIKARTFRKPGDHVYIKRDTPNSWTPGTELLLGEDCIDFDITLVSVDLAAKEATLFVRHLPPSRTCVKLAANWMRTPVADTPNNWVEVKKTPAGKFRAEVGKEIIDVELKIDLDTGRIRSATIDNPVTTIVRDCTNAALTKCGKSRPSREFRHIVIRSINSASE